MAIVRLKTFYRDQAMNEVLRSFGLPRIEYPKGYQAKPTSELTGGSAATEDIGLKAVKELLRWTRKSVN